MKKLNKKGFTLAELLIVIAIIAILIAIAIPAFSASLRSAKLAVDHSNIRAMYAVLRTAEMTNSIDNGTGTDTPANTETNTYYLLKDGTIEKATGSTVPTNAYKLQVNAELTECENSYLCTHDETGTAITKGSEIHKENQYITIQYDKGTWKFAFAS